MKVLVVGEPRVAHGMLQSFLRRSDCEVLVCSSAREALTVAEVERPDLIALIHPIDPDDRAADDDTACSRALQARSAASGPPLVHVHAPRGTAPLESTIAAMHDPGQALDRIAELLGVPRRGRARRALRLRVDFYGPDDRPGVGHTRDLSESGMFLRSDRPLAVGDPLQLIFSLPLPGRPTVRAAGEVVHRHAGSAPSGGGLGVRFRKVGERDRRALAGLVAAAGRAGT